MSYTAAIGLEFQLEGSLTEKQNKDLKDQIEIAMEDFRESLEGDIERFIKEIDGVSLVEDSLEAVLEDFDPNYGRE